MASRKVNLQLMHLLSLLKIFIVHSMKKKHDVSVMIDLTKAFDTVNHEILLEMMELNGIRERRLNLFRNYLSNRKSFVRWGSKSSSLKMMNVVVGVPQGSQWSL